MGSAYTILGKTVQPHVLALATIVGTVGGAIIASSGDKSEAPAAAPAPAAKADDLDVEKLLNDFLKEEKK